MTGRSRRVAVTGLGLVSPHGQDVQAAFDSLLRGESKVGLNMVGEAPYETRIPSAVCEGFDALPLLGKPKVQTMDRVAQLSTVAAEAAWNDAGLKDLPQDQREDIAVMWGTGLAGNGTVERGYRELFIKQRPRLSPMTMVLAMNNAAASQVSLHLNLGGPCMTYSVACASSAIAIGEAMRRVRDGECTVAVAGGADAALPFGTVAAWQSLRVLAAIDEANPGAACRPFDASRTGIVLAEGSAALVLEDWDHAQARGAHVYAELLGYGSSCDHAHLVAPDAKGQQRALRAALRMADIAATDIRYVNAHGTATPDGDPVEIAALIEAMGAEAAAKLMVSSTKSMHGHMMGAAGAMEALVTIKSVEQGAVPPTAHLSEVDPACQGVDHVMGEARRGLELPVAISNSFAFGGSNAVLVFGRA